MRRWFAILLLVLLPTQMTWAVVVDYCAHESGMAAGHLGHHDHPAHDDDWMLSDAPHTPISGDDATAGISHDCGHCHGHYVGMPLAIEPLQPERFSSASALPREGPWAQHVAARPERPQWARLA